MAAVGPALRRERILALVAARGRARVGDLAEELGAAPVTVRRDVEALAREGLVNRRHGLVLAPSGGRGGPRLGTVVAITSSSSAYLGEILLGSQQAVADAGGRFVLDVAREAATMRRALDRAAATPGISGILFAPSWRSPEEIATDLTATLPRRLPLVLLERFAPRGSSLAQRDAVRSDHASGVHQALSHLRSHGHRRVLLFCRDDSPTARTVRACFADAQRSLGLPVLAEPLLSSDRADQQHRADAPDPVEAVRRYGATAVVVHSDLDALALLPRFEAEGVPVPQAVSLVAYDDVVAGLGDVRLTTVAPAKREVGSAGVELLQWRIENPDAPTRRLEIGTHLVPRNSVRTLPPRSNDQR